MILSRKSLELDIRMIKLTLHLVLQILVKLYSHADAMYEDYQKSPMRERHVSLNHRRSPVMSHQSTITLIKLFRAAI